MDQNRFLTWLKKLAHDVLSNIIAAIVVVVLGDRRHCYNKTRLVGRDRTIPCRLNPVSQLGSHPHTAGDRCLDDRGVPHEND